MGAVGNWISDAWKSTVGQAWEVIGVNQLWEASGAQDLWENAYDSARDALSLSSDDNNSQTLNSSSSSDSTASGISTSETDTTDDGSSGVEEKSNVGGEGAASVATQKQLAAKSSLVGSGLSTFGFTEESGNGAGKVKKLGA